MPKVNVVGLDSDTFLINHEWLNSSIQSINLSHQSMSVSGNVSGSAASNVTLTPTGGWTDGDFWE